MNSEYLFHASCESPLFTAGPLGQHSRSLVIAWAGERAAVPLAALNCGGSAAVALPAPLRLHGDFGPYRCSSGNTPCSQHSAIVTHFALPHYDCAQQRGCWPSVFQVGCPLPKTPSQSRCCVIFASFLPYSCQAEFGAGRCVAEAHWVPGRQFPAAMSGGNGDEALLGEGSRYHKARAIGAKRSWSMRRPSLPSAAGPRGKGDRGPWGSSIAPGSPALASGPLTPPLPRDPRRFCR